MRQIISLEKSVYLIVIIIAAGVCAHATAAYRVPACFLENLGQVPAPDVNYYFHSPYLEVFLEDSGDITYQFPAAPAFGTSARWNVREKFLGAGRPEIEGTDPSEACFSFFTSDVRCANVQGYGRVTLKNIYPGIAVSLVSSGNTVEKVFTIAPGGDPGRIRCEVMGASGIEVLDNGDLEIRSDAGDFRLVAPKAYQVVDGNVRHVEVSYATDGRRYRFSLGDYDREKPLVIDPLLASTVIGGAGGGFDEIQDMTIGADGTVYVVGTTSHANFPATPGAYDSSVEDEDAFVAVFDAKLGALKYSTVVGGSGKEAGKAVALGADGSIYVAGTTYSGDYPVTSGAYDTSYGEGNSRDCFISKFDRTLAHLLASTYLGGNDLEIAEHIAVNSQGNVYIGGQTCSDDFPTTASAFDQDYGFGNAGFISALSGDLAQLVGSSFLGENYVFVNDIICTETNRLFLVGETYDENFPTSKSAYQPEFQGGEMDAFICEISPDISKILASTFLGGSFGDRGISVKSCNDKYLVVAGATTSDDFPVSDNAFRTENTYFDMVSFIAKMDLSLEHLLGGTYFGGRHEVPGDSFFGDIIVSESGEIYLGLSAKDSSLPRTKGGYQEHGNGEFDVYIAHLDPDLTTTLHTTFLGGVDEDWVFRMCFDPEGNVCVAGKTYGGFPTTESAYQHSGNNINGFIAKLDPLLLEDTLNFRLETPSEWIYPGDEFFLDVVIVNPDEDYEDIPVFVLLSFGEDFWFWPSWVKYPPDYDYQAMDIPYGVTEFYAIEPFIWPHLSISDFDLVFYGALLYPDLSGILSNVAEITIRVYS